MGCSRAGSHLAGVLGGKRGVLAPASPEPPRELHPSPPPRCPSARPAARANTSGVRGSRSGKARGHPIAPGRPLCALPDARPVPGGAASREAAALQPEMLGPGAALPASLELLADRRQLRLTLPGTRPTRAEIAEKRGAGLPG